MTDTQSSIPPRRSFWLLALSYVSAFILGACIDIIRHSYDRIQPAVQSGSVDNAIIQRAIIAAALTIIVITGVYFGSRWSGNQFGIRHRTSLQALFVLTPAIVYLLEH